MVFTATSRRLRRTVVSAERLTRPAVLVTNWTDILATAISTTKLLVSAAVIAELHTKSAVLDTHMRVTHVDALLDLSEIKLSLTC